MSDLIDGDEFLRRAALFEAERAQGSTLAGETQSEAPPVSREVLTDFVRGICEDSLPGRGLRPKVSGLRAIELAAWDLYRRLQEQGEL